MGITAEQAEVLRASEEGFTCIRCRISSLFTSAEQAMLTAMKRWMPSTCFAEQAGFDETPLADDSGKYASHVSLDFALYLSSVRVYPPTSLRRVFSSLVTSGMYMLIDIDCLRVRCTRSRPLASFAEFRCLGWCGERCHEPSSQEDQDQPGGALRG